MSMDPTTQAKAVAVLRKLPLFRGLTEREQYSVLHVCRTRFLEAKAVLFREGDEASGLFILLSGGLDVLMEGRGLVHSMEAGEVLGEIGLMWEGTRTASAVAREDTTLLELDTGPLNDLFETQPRLGYVVMRNIATTLAERLTRETRK